MLKSKKPQTYKSKKRNSGHVDQDSRESMKT